MPSYLPVPVVFANDEDIAVRAEGDFAVLVPKAQKRAAGTDGVLTAGAWTLSSASVNFAAQGVTYGMVVQITTARAGSSAPNPTPEMFAVDGVVTNTLTLRRVGEAAGVGQPPAAVSAAGVSFKIPTFGPQIESVSYDLDRRYGISRSLPGRTTADFFDVREVNAACVLEVLRRQCVAQARQEKDDTLWAKAGDYKQEYDDTVGRGIVHWRDLGGFGQAITEPSTSVFGMRISR